jgi:hypothetical protein
MRWEDANRLRDNDEYRRHTGSVSCDDPVVALLYNLMRDHLPTGVIQTIIDDCLKHPGGYTFTDGHLARSAQLMADRLRRS